MGVETLVTLHDGRDGKGDKVSKIQSRFARHPAESCINLHQCMDSSYFLQGMSRGSKVTSLTIG